MNKKEAVKELKQGAEDAKRLLESEAFSEEHTRWYFNVDSILSEVFGQNSKYYLSFQSLPWKATGSLLLGGAAHPEEIWDTEGAVKRKHHEAYQKQLMSARGLLLAAIDAIERADSIEDLYEGKNTAPESSEIIRIIHLAENDLRKIFFKSPENEIDIQNAFYSLLVGAGIDHSRETEHIEYSSKTYVPDFSVPHLDLVIEIKFCGTGSKEKALIAEINDDIRAYSSAHGNIIFIVFDLGFIRDVDRFRSDLEDSDSVVVLVVKK